MSVVEILKGRTRSKPVDPEKPRDLAELLPDRDPIVAARQTEEDQLLPQLDKAKVELDQLIGQKADADAHLRSQRLLRAQGRPASVDRAEAERDRVAVRVNDQRKLITDLEGTLVDARLATRQAQVDAVQRAYPAGIAEAGAIVNEEHGHHQALIALVARRREIHRFLEMVAAEAKRLEVPGCALSPQASLVLDGHCPSSNSAAWLTILFGGPDTRAPRGGGLYLWRHAAIEAGLLEPTGEVKAEREREKRRRAEALVQNAIREDAIKAHLGRVWGDTDRRDYSMKD
jgi:hypothetical protein